MLAHRVREKHTLNPFDNVKLEGVQGVYPVTEIHFFIQSHIILYSFDI